MANRIISVHAGIYGMGIYAIMLPSSGFSVAHCVKPETLNGQLLLPKWCHMSMVSVTTGRPDIVCVL